MRASCHRVECMWERTSRRPPRSAHPERAVQQWITIPRHRRPASYSPMPLLLNRLKREHLARAVTSLISQPRAGEDGEDDDFHFVCLYW
jgi:hypothetical protein